MKWRIDLGRAVPATLMGAFCLFAGACAVDRPHSAPPVATGPATGEYLSAAELRRAEAVAHYATGISLEITRGATSAVPEYITAFQLAPQDSAIGFRLAQIYASQKDYTNAVAVLEQVATTAPKSAEPWFWLGVIYRASEQTPQAITALKKALKLDPTYMVALQNLVELQLAETPAATQIPQLLSTAAQQSTSNWEYWARLGDLYTSVLKQKPSLAGQLGKNPTRQCYEKARALAPNEPEILVRLAGSYTDANEYQQAAAIYARLLELRPNLPHVRERLAYAYVRADQHDRALATFTQILQTDPLRYDLYNSIGALDEELNKDEAALAAYQQSLTINPSQLAPVLRIALLQMKLHRYDDALQSLTAAKEKHPIAYQIPYFMGLVDSDQKNFEKAMAAFADAQTLAETAPDNPKLDATFYFYFASACERAGNLDKAAALFRRSIELDPDRAASYNYLGYMWADKGIHLDEAFDLIKKAVAKEPENPAYLDSLGWVLFKLGRPADALPHLRRAVELMAKEKDPAQQVDATVLDHLADVLLKLGKHEEAVATLRRAVAAEPKNKDLSEKLNKLTNTK